MEPRKIRPVVLEIEGMVCENCRSKIEKGHLEKLTFVTFSRLPASSKSL